MLHFNFYHKNPRQPTIAMHLQIFIVGINGLCKHHLPHGVVYQQHRIFTRWQLIIHIKLPFCRVGVNSQIKVFIVYGFCYTQAEAVADAADYGAEEIVGEVGDGVADWSW